MNMLKVVICLSLLFALAAAHAQDKADQVLLSSICAKYPSLCGGGKLLVAQDDQQQDVEQDLEQVLDQDMGQDLSQQSPNTGLQINDAATSRTNEVVEIAKFRKSGVVFTRWGNKRCPRTSGTKLVYSGITGGTHFTHRGGASNYLCMPPEPKYTLKTRPGVQGHAYVFGSEYELPLHGVHDHDVPCAVCLASFRQTTLMIPGTTECPERWNAEYRGYLMTSHIKHHRTEYVCVDQAQQSLPGSYANLNGVLLYHTEPHCSGLPCPPYSPAKELTCVVCSI